jgi:hypothetical protein
MGYHGAVVRLRVTYGKTSDLSRAVEEELGRGVLLVRVPPPPDLPFRAPVALEIVAPGGGALCIDTEVEALLPGLGVAVAFPRARIAEARALAPPAPDPPDAAAPAYEIVDDLPPEPEPAPEPAARAGAAGEHLTMAERIRLALHGNRDDRGSILRDKTRSLHCYVLKNANITLDEVTAYAKNPQMTPEFLRQIADRKEWLSRPAIAVALARNPKTPPEVTIRALDHIGTEGLRQLVKSPGTPPAVIAAARKKLIGR